MPELPEVETIARDLDNIVSGRTLEEVAVSFDKIVASAQESFAPLLTGATIKSVERLGKWIIFKLEGGLISGSKALLAHLKMTGQFSLGPWPTDRASWPPHARAAFRLSGSGELNTLFYRDIRKFGRLRAFAQKELEIFLQKLAQGPDPLLLSPDAFHQALTRKKGRLKGVLLDQTVVSGLGNIYVDEGLFAAGISPLRSAATLTPPEAGSLLKELQRILRTSIKARGSTTSNYQGLKGGGHFQHSHQVYGRAGQPCPRCQTPLDRTTIAGRTTIHCPHCQADGGN